MDHFRKIDNAATIAARETCKNKGSLALDALQYGCCPMCFKGFRPGFGRWVRNINDPLSERLVLDCYACGHEWEFGSVNLTIKTT